MWYAIPISSVVSSCTYTPGVLADLSTGNGEELGAFDHDDEETGDPCAFHEQCK